MKNGVSCLCLTYGRPGLLEEAIESFLRQDYTAPKELIVLNDHPKQRLRFDHPEITVINLPRRLKTLGEKRNLSVALAKYDNLLVWDDDDIYLPWRISETMKTLTKAQFFKCPNAWVMNNGKIDPKPGYNLFHGGSAYTRWLFQKAGGYTMMNGGEDADIEKRFQLVTDEDNVLEIPQNAPYWPHTTLPNDRLYYIYRWSHGSYHTTGHSHLSSINPKIVEGDIDLTPFWKEDYVALASIAAAIPKNDFEEVYTKAVQKVEADTVAEKVFYAKQRNTVPINFISFSRNRPLQLDGYLRSIKLAFGQELPMSVIYTCDAPFDNAYKKLIETFYWVNFVRETAFSENLLSLWDDKRYVCFGCDDVVFNRKVNLSEVLHRMENEQQFAFSFRLGKNVKRSMFSGDFKQPKWIDDSKMLTWNLHESHPHGDFGYSWELDGTVYHADVARQVVEEINPASPNLLEANGGGKWSSKTKRSLMSCYQHSCLVVPTVNVVQRNFQNATLGKALTPEFLLRAYESGLRLDVEHYTELKNDCIHVPNFYLTNL
jgi:glycosyltransferase involved in cell wall biosynthesis